MSYKKGEIHNPNGRGNSPNKVSAQVRSAVANIVANNLMQFQSDLMQLDAKERCDVMLKLLRFCIPTITSIQIDEEQAKTATEHLQALATWSDHATHQNNINEKNNTRR